MTAEHGGPDARGIARWDFSTNSNAVGPCEAVRDALRSVDSSRYPDPSYHALREVLSAWHGVAPERVLMAASASEFIQRITAVSERLAPGGVALPTHAYGDCARAARACGRALLVADDPHATLRWQCEPSSPLGADDPPPPEITVATVLDAVYEPLRLQGSSTWRAPLRDRVFTLHSPNKALGLTGLRAAYAVAPAGAAWAPWLRALADAAPSWPVGAHGVALLHAWPTAPVQRWLAESLILLREWKTAQCTCLRALDIDTRPSVTPYFCARLGVPPQALRAHGVQVRDATSFGLPGWTRLSVQPPAAQDALLHALRVAGRSA